MDFLTSSVPAWVSVLFMLTFPIIIFLIANAARQAAGNAGLPTDKTNRLWWGIVGFYVAFFAYTTIMSRLGFFDQLTLPPPIFLFTTIPLLVFYFGFVTRTNLYRTLLQNVPLETLIRIHVFRFVGVFFLINLWYDALPERFALVAGIGDVFTAASGLWVANAVAKRKPWSYRVALLWNIIGFWDIVSVIASGLLTAQQAQAGVADALRLANIADVPFCWIPAVAPATIIFLHMGIFRKLKIERNEKALSSRQTAYSSM